MEPTLHQLKVFVTVARTLSFSRAAHELLLSQPAVSMQIKSLERGLGLKLFDHVGRRVQLTEAGVDLSARAARILGLAEEAMQEMSDRRHLRAGRLRVVATTTVGIYVVPNLLGEFHRRHPDVAISLEVANWERTCERLFAGGADVAVAGPHPQLGLRMEPFMDDKLVVIASPTHPLARQTTVSLEALVREPIVVREAGSGTRAAVEAMFAARQLPWRRAMELSRNGAVKQVVQAGLGVAVISRGGDLPGAGRQHALRLERGGIPHRPGLARHHPCRLCPQPGSFRLLRPAGGDAIPAPRVVPAVPYLRTWTQGAVARIPGYV